jgi:hyperosmotically inducible protein
MNMKIFLKSTILLAALAMTSYSMAQTTVVVPDANITTIVKNKLDADKSLANTKIDVKTSQGVVDLSGNVSSNTQAATATELAQSMIGVKDVDTSHLTVNDSQQPMADAFITAKIKGSFIQQKLFGDKDIASINISVETNDGIVSLSGFADNQKQISNAIIIAKAVVGVKDVKSTIVVR